MNDGKKRAMTGNKRGKCSFLNPDVNKQDVQVIFSQKKNKSIHPPFFSNEAPAVMKDEKRHLGMILNSPLNFHSHVKEKIVEVGELE